MSDVREGLAVIDVPSTITPVPATPQQLDDLHHDEAIIERGLSTFVEVGAALVRIRDGKKYKADGYRTFDDYCRERWGMSQQHAGNLMRAVTITGALGTETTVSVLPVRESQVRPLAVLPFNRAAQAWEAAVREAGGEQPTAQQVKAAAARHLPFAKPDPVPDREDRRQQAVELRAQGKSIDQIADELGVRKSLVQDDLRDEPKQPPVSIRFPADVLEQARAAAESQGQSLSEFVVAAVRSRLANRDRERARRAAGGDGET